MAREYGKLISDLDNPCFFNDGKDMKRKISGNHVQLIPIETSPETQKKIKRSHDELFESIDLNNPTSFIGNKDRKNKHSGPFKIYSLANIQELIEEESAHKKAKSSHIKLRFILTNTFELYFAKEGPAGTKIPSHGNMTGCLPNEAKAYSAGNIGLNEKGELNFFSNKSGDFRPSWDSGQLSLAILLNSNLAIAAKIKLEKFSLNGSAEPKFEIDSFELREDIEDKIPLELRTQWQKLNSACPNHTYFYHPETGPAEYDPLVHDTKTIRGARPFKPINFFDRLASHEGPAETSESPIKPNGLFARFLADETDEIGFYEEEDTTTEVTSDRFSTSTKKVLWS